MKKITCLRYYDSVPIMRHWELVELTSENIVDYFSELKYRVTESKRSVPFNILLQMESQESVSDTINTMNFTTNDLDKLENLLNDEILEGLEINEYISLPQYVAFAEYLKEYNQITSNNMSYIPIGLGNVKLYGNNHSIRGDIHTVKKQMDIDIITHRLIEKGFEKEDALLISATNLAKRVVNGELRLGDKEIVDYLNDATEFDESILTKIQKQELNSIRLNKYNLDLINEIEKHANKIAQSQTLEDVEMYLNANNLGISKTHYIINDEFAELTSEFVRNEKQNPIIRKLSGEYQGYVIIESELNSHCL